MESALLNKLFLYIVIILSAVIHEYSHGWMAEQLGDNTAKRMGRLTLNPIVHIDLVGTVILPLFLLFTGGIFIGWAKPVPYNPYNTKDPEKSTMLIGLAGPASNLALALILGSVLRFNLIPSLAGFLGAIVMVNIYLFLFNLIPVPPLDGSKVFSKFLPYNIKQSLSGIGIGMFVALLLAFMILPPVANFLFQILTGLTGLPVM